MRHGEPVTIPSGRSHQDSRDHMADVHRSLGTPTLCRQVLRHHSPPTARHGNLTESVHQVQLTCGFHAVALRSHQQQALACASFDQSEVFETLSSAPRYSANTCSAQSSSESDTVSPRFARPSMVSSASMPAQLRAAYSRRDCPSTNTCTRELHVHANT